MKTVLIALGLACMALAAPSSSPIEAGLYQTLEANGTATIIVSFKDARVEEVRERAAAVRYADRTARLNGLYNALKSHADETQANVLSLLEQAKASNPSLVVRQLWITNEIIVRNANKDVMELLAASNEVAGIRQERIYSIIKPVETIVHPEGFVPHAGEQWGVAKIEAPSVWAAGNKGQGVVVATIDTGVRGTHVALRDNHRSSYGWYDAYSGSSSPRDDNGHGTHTMGTLVGTQNGIGVAPGAQWIACKGCDGNAGCADSTLLECGQWVACPTLPDGGSPDCSQAPHISSNSWGGGQGNTWYNNVIATWVAAGIAPMFAIGNSGPLCFTANSPGDSTQAIGVGSTTDADRVSSFSSVGPTLFGLRTKPDVAAPGSNVVSAYHTGDTIYATLSGTSMATPHAAGLAALLYSENPNISVNSVKTALAAGAQPTNPTGLNCGLISENTYPNNHVGAGRINAPASVAVARKLAAAQL